MKALSRIGKLLAVIILLSCMADATAQDVRKDMEKVNQAYSRYSNLSFNISYNLYKNHTTAYVSQSKTGSYLQKGNTKLTDIEGFISLYTPEATVIIDTTAKKIVVSNAAKFQIDNMTVVNFDSLMHLYNSVDYKGITGSNKTYYFNIKQTIYSPFDAIAISFDKETFLLTKLVLYFRYPMKLDEKDESEAAEKTRMEIVFSAINTKAKAVSGRLSLSDYIKKTADGYKGAGIYKNYQVLDQRLNK